MYRHMGHLGYDANQALENLSILAENIPELEIFLVDDCQQVHCKLGNESQRQGWCRNSEKESEFLNFFPPEEANTLKSLLKIAFEDTPVSTELTINSGFFSIRMIPLKQKNDAPKCVVVLQNITDIKRAEKKLRLSKQKAEKASQAKDQFVARMSHEIRTPLNAIIGFADQLHQTRLSKKQANYLTVIDNASHHLLSTIDDILVLSKIESEEIEIEATPFTITGILQTVEQVLTHKSKEKKLLFLVSFDGSMEHILMGDPAKLRQVLINLADNSIKFTQKGSVSVTCTLVEQTNAAQTIRFEIADTGIGISAEDIDTIFKPFHQVNNRLDRNFSGCGLGLAISKDLIRAMGGKLEVESTPGKGSTFFFTLTFERGKQLTAADNDVYGISVPLQNLRILFVDDDPVNRMLGKIIFKKHKIKAEFAASGKEAMEKFTPGEYHFVFLDINLPDMRGTEVARLFREKEQGSHPPHNTRLIAMTANTLKRQLKEYLSAGMDSMMLKPYKEETLIKKIVALMSGSTRVNIQPDKSVKQQKKKQPYNLDQLHQITDGDPEFMNLMLTSFIDNSEILHQQIASGFGRDDYAGIAEAAHRLHPSMEQLGFASTTDLLKKIEKRYLRKKTFTKDSRLIKKTILEVQKSIDAIMKLVKGKN
jgi:signal transduction histidine kinase/CheY-like chemotaxis protein/HPt (histidine-containing phosphotransfer) domain-containing protein